MARSKWKISLAISWLIFTISLAGWWMYFTLDLLGQSGQMDDHFLRQKNMLIWEGGTWFLLLLGGGVAIIYYTIREQKQSDRIKKFLAAFSHDLKTALASLRLQSESLKEDLQGTESEPLLNRLIGDAGRLQLQLENSLFLGRGDMADPFLEEISIQEFVGSIQHQWPSLNIRFETDAKVKADRRALESIFRNIIQNSVVHGGASELIVRTTELPSKKIEVSIKDNGSGFSGDISSLGNVFQRHSASSGTGMGIYIVNQHLKNISGSAQFNSSDSGFVVTLQLNGALS